MLIGLFLDPLFLVFFVPGVLLSFAATAYTKSTFAKYSKIYARDGLTGAEAARKMLARQGVDNVEIKRVRGVLTDHYDPSNRTLRLSDKVYDSNSLAAIGVACHEAGHAVQHAQNYAFLSMRSALAPVASFGSNMAYILLFIGVIFHTLNLVLLGALVFGGVVLFSLVTLPVEWNASSRAKEVMARAGIVREQEMRQASTVLNAAFLTYVAAAVTALLQMLYFLLHAFLLGGEE